jgi:hypothetical protein
MSYVSPGPPSPVAALSAGDTPCSLAASADGVFWTGLGGTLLAPKDGGAPVNITYTSFDRAGAPYVFGQVLVATSNWELNLYQFPQPCPPGIRASTARGICRRPSRRLVISCLRGGPGDYGL